MMDRNERAVRIARYLVRGWSGFRGKLYLMVLEEKGTPVPFEWHWKRKNIRGVVFEPNDVTRAEAWVKRALLAGHTVFHCWSKNAPSAGRGLEDWPLPWDWDDERGCWDCDKDSVDRRLRAQTDHGR